jgi:ribosomal-protein-alanine N-acetyltransferase
MPTLVTPRLRLRPFTETDLEDVWVYASDPEVSRWVKWDTHRSLDDTRAFLRWTVDAYNLPEPSTWAIADVATDRVIGSIGWASWHPTHGRGEIGYVLARHAWGRGLATEAVRAVIRYGFEQLELHKITAHCHVQNIASRRVLERVGMQIEGTLREHLFLKGKWWDLHVMATLRRAWRG